LRLIFFGNHLQDTTSGLGLTTRQPLIALLLLQNLASSTCIDPAVRPKIEAFQLDFMLADRPETPIYRVACSPKEPAAAGDVDQQTGDLGSSQSNANQTAERAPLSHNL
jgi:hypothetical protein